MVRSFQGKMSFVFFSSLSCHKAVHLSPWEILLIIVSPVGSQNCPEHFYYQLANICIMVHLYGICPSEKVPKTLSNRSAQMHLLP